MYLHVYECFVHRAEIFGLFNSWCNLSFSFPSSQRLPVMDMILLSSHLAFYLQQLVKGYGTTVRLVGDSIWSGSYMAWYFQAGLVAESWNYSSNCVWWVRCISAAVHGTCKPGQTIQVRIVDRAYSSVSRPTSDRATIVLSTTAFLSIADASAASVNVEYSQ